jgi:hypothetical protein
MKLRTQRAGDIEINIGEVEDVNLQVEASGMILI